MLAIASHRTHIAAAIPCPYFEQGTKFRTSLFCVLSFAALPLHDRVNSRTSGDADGEGEEAVPAEATLSTREPCRSDAGPRAMFRVLQLLATLSNEPRGLTLSQIARALNVPKSTLVSMLRPLVADGYLTTQGSSYRLGAASFRLAAKMMSGFSVGGLMRNYIVELAEKTRESVGLAVPEWDAGRVIYVDSEQSSQPVHYAMRTGLNAPLYASAAGRVILAFSPAELVDAYLERPSFRALTSRTVVDPARIRERIANVRSKGYCVSSGELLPDTSAMAVPVFGIHDELVGALMVAAPIERMRLHEEEILALLIEAGQRASGRRIAA